MSNEPLVCICIPNYNNEATISQTLDSVVNQTYKNVIIKIFDNASTDNSMKILNKYESRFNNIQVYQNKENIGGEANFTKCIEGLEGDYGAIYHADDIYGVTMVETQVNYLSKNEISAVFVRANLIDDNGSSIGEQFFPEELKSKSYHQFDFKQLFSLVLKYDNFLITPSVMAKVDIYKNNIKSFNGEKFKTSSDLDAWLRFSEIKDIGIITEKLISYRMSISSYSYRGKYKRFLPTAMFLVMDFYLDKYSEIEFDNADFKYLKFYDNILLKTNKILNNYSVEPKEIRLFDWKILTKVFFDKRKFKIYLYSVLFKTLLVLRLKKVLLNIIRKVIKIPKDVLFYN